MKIGLWLNCSSPFPVKKLWRCSSPLGEWRDYEVHGNSRKVRFRSLRLVWVHWILDTDETDHVGIVKIGIQKGENIGYTKQEFDLKDSHFFPLPPGGTEFYFLDPCSAKQINMETWNLGLVGFLWCLSNCRNIWTPVAQGSPWGAFKFTI